LDLGKGEENFQEVSIESMSGQADAKLAPFKSKGLTSFFDKKMKIVLKSNYHHLVTFSARAKKKKNVSVPKQFSKNPSIVGDAL
jgi:hypothetical protein